MLLIADIHVHSKYSRATSKALSPEGLIDAARVKGIDVIGTGDFTHPKYLNELKEKLIPHPDKSGFFVLKTMKREALAPVFMLTQEISCIYTDNGKGRRNHILIALPDFDSVDRLSASLQKIGNLGSDGRPILGISAKDLAERALEAHKSAMIIPAHIWTPWFSTFGSKSGYDSIAECFGDMAPHIAAVETGLSSDPLMNWRVSELDRYAIVSHGDAHSPRKVGREATVYEVESPLYENIANALKASARLDKANLPKNYIAFTIEFYPEEGKYHFDGHRACNVSFAPEETKKNNGLCPHCRKPLTIGVEYRVETLAARTIDEARVYGKINRPDFKKIIPLEEIIADAFGQGIGTKKVSALYDKLIKQGGSEFEILLHKSQTDLAAIAPPEIVKGILRVRAGSVYITPGYDGVFGKVSVFSDEERASFSGRQTRLF